MLKCWLLQQQVCEQRMMLHSCLPSSRVIQESLDVTACAWRLQHDAVRSQLPLSSVRPLSRHSAGSHAVAFELSNIDS